MERSWRNSYRNMTPLTLLVLLIALVSFVCGTSAPYVLPTVRDKPLIQYLAAMTTVNCADLASPLGGNNRAILGNANNDEALDLDLRLDKRTFAVGEAIELEIRFFNRDNGPITLFFNENTPPPLSVNEATNQGFAGITFSIERVGGARLIDQGTVPTAPSTFELNTLHVLGSRARCIEEYSLAADRLQLIGLSAGEYRISAVYSNTNPGVRPPQELAPPVPTPTPFPAYRADQNVWTGRTRSNEVRFEVTE